MDDYPITIELPVLWGDMDALGHVNNTVYFKWFESARIATFERIGVNADAPGEVGPILATTECTFRQPVKYPDRIIAGCRIAKLGNTSFVMEYGIARASAPETLVASGSGVVVLVNYASGEKVSVPDDLRGRLEELV